MLCTSFDKAVCQTAENFLLSCALILWDYSLSKALSSFGQRSHFLF